MTTRAKTVDSLSSPLSRSHSSLSDNGERSPSVSPHRGPSTPLQEEIKSDDNSDEHHSSDREFLTSSNKKKSNLEETTSTVLSDAEENDEKKKSHHHQHHHHHRHRHKEAKLKSKKRSSNHERRSVKRSKRESNTSSKRQKSDGENSRSSSAKKSTESEASKSDHEIFNSNQQSPVEKEEEEEEGLIEANSSPPNERVNRNRHRRKKRQSPISSHEKRHSSSESSQSATIGDLHKATQLIVNYLPSTVRESELYQLFARVAPVKLCKLVTDRRTGHSHGYGFVEYYTKEDAIQAIEKYNGFRIEQKKLKVSYAKLKSTSSNEHDQHEKAARSASSKNPNLYITELPDDFDERMLERLFSKHGEIVKTKILRDPRTKISRGVGFVLMTSTRYAERAIKALDGFVPSGCRTPISVKYADPNKSVSSNNVTNTCKIPSQASMSTTIGPYGYPPIGTMPPINMIDSNYGNLPMNYRHRGRSARDPRDITPPSPPALARYHSGGSSRSHNNHASGSSASRSRISPPTLTRSYSSSSSKHSLNVTIPQTSIPNKSNVLSAAYDLIAKGFHQAIDPNGFVIYAFGLPHDCNENDLEELFRRYGEVYRVYIVRNYTTGESKGYSFVTMRHYEEACVAVSRLDGSTFQGRTIQVRFKQ